MVGGRRLLSYGNGVKTAVQGQCAEASGSERNSSEVPGPMFVLRRIWHCLLMLWKAVKSIGARATPAVGAIPTGSGYGMIVKIGKLTIKNCCLSIFNQQILDMGVFQTKGYPQ